MLRQDSTEPARAGHALPLLRADGPAPGWVRQARDIAIGMLAPTVVAVLVGTADLPSRLRPGVVLMPVVVAVAVILGFRAGIVATAASTVWLWWRFTQPVDSWKVPHLVDVAGLALFLVSAAGVLFLVWRLTITGRRETQHRLLAEAVISRAPVGIAVLDRNHRITEINAVLARVNGGTEADHVGRRPSDLELPIAEDRFIEQAFVDDVSILDRMISTGGRGRDEQHLKVSYVPINDQLDAVAAIATIVEDVTAEVMTRRRNEGLLGLATALSAVDSVQSLAETAADFLVRTFGAWTSVGVVEAGEIVIIAQGDPAGSVRAVDDQRIDLEDGSPLATVVATREMIVIASNEERAAQSTGEVANSGVAGDETWLGVAIVDPGDRNRALGVLRAAWPYRRTVSDNSRTLLRTVATMLGLVWERLDLTAAAEQDRFRAALDASLDDVVLTTAVRDRAGGIVDFEIDYANAHSLDGAGRSAVEVTGRRVVDLYPSLKTSGLFDRFVEVVETGIPFVVERHRYDDELPDGTPIHGLWNIQVLKIDDGYIAASRNVTDVVEAERIARDAELESMQVRLTVELLQRAALPTTLPDVDLLRLGVHYQPANTAQPVGGDWYDAFAIDDDRYAVVIADVSGHGTDAAAFMVQVRNILRAIALEYRRPAEVLARTNRLIASLGPSSGLFVTACYGLLDTRDGTFEWALAGHPPPLLVDADGGVRVLASPAGVPLAFLPDATYEASEVELPIGGRLVLYTDGLIERRGEVIDWGIERLAAALGATWALDVQAAAEELAAEVSLHDDDVAILIAEFVGSRSDATTDRPPAGLSTVDPGPGSRGSRRSSSL